MTNEIINTETGEVSRAVGQALQDWTPAQIDLMRRQIVPKDVTDDEFKVFLHVARHKQLDPFRGQIYAVKRAGRMNIQTGIDGYASLAARTGEFVGMDEPKYGYLKDGGLDSCTITAYRMVAGLKCAFTATAFLSEYYVPTNALWKKMERTMLAKCARALAFRIAFPDELGGIYTGDEMEQAGTPVPHQAKSVTVEADDESATEPQTEQPKQAKPSAVAIEREMPSKYGTEDKPNKCGFCGKFHIIQGDRIVLFENKWGKEECIVVAPDGSVQEPRASQPQVKAVFAAIANLRANKTLTSLPDLLYQKCEQWELGSYEKTAANAKWLLDNLAMFNNKSASKQALLEQESMPFDDVPFPEEE